jgi:hypothetical protein
MYERTYTRTSGGEEEEGWPELRRINDNCKKGERERKREREREREKK